MAEIENNDEMMQSQPAADEGVVDEDSIPLEADRPRNTTAILFMGLMMIGGGTLYFMSMRAGPKAAVASPDATTAKETIDKFLTDGDKNMLAMKEMLKNTEGIVQQFLKGPNLPDIELETNPFRLLSAKAEPKVDEEAERLKKLAAEREAEKKAILESVQTLRIQSIIGGRTPTCMINSKMYIEGQEVEGFTIEKIKPGAVTVRQKDYRFELKITQ